MEEPRRRTGIATPPVPNPDAPSISCYNASGTRTLRVSGTTPAASSVCPTVHGTCPARRAGTRAPSGHTPHGAFVHKHTMLGLGPHPKPPPSPTLAQR